jgi:EAL domain-containing protein (putative c-di-GMP-specific phosphodiesterase class I)
MHWLRANGCDQAQSFYFNRPPAIEELTVFLHQANTAFPSAMQGNT